MATLRDLITKIRFDVNTAPLEKVGKSLDAIKGRLNLLVGIEMLRGLAELTDRFGNFALDLRNTAAAAGLSTEEFQKLAYAASQSGISQEELGKTLSNLNKKLNAARLGSEEAALSFSRAGISPEQLGNFKDAESALFALQKSLGGIADPVLRAAVAEETLGEAGRKLLGSVGDGTQSLQALAKGSDAAAAVINDKLLDASIEAEKAMLALRQQTKSLAAQLAGALAPAVTEALKGINAFLVANRELIRLTFDRFVYNFGYAMGFAKGVIEDVSLLVIQLVRKLAQWGEDSGLFGAIRSGFETLGEAVGTIFEAMGTSINWVLEKMAALKVWFERVDLGSIRGWARVFEDIATALGKLSLTALINGLDTVRSLLDTIMLLLSGKSFSGTILGQAMSAISGMADFARGNMGGNAIGNPAPLKPFDPAPMANAGIMLAQAQGPNPNSPLLNPQSDSAGPAQVQMVTNAPVTINITGDANSGPVLQAVKDGIAEHHDKIMRQTQVEAPQWGNY